MNLEKLFALQKELDLRIRSEHNLQSHNLIQMKILALQVEIGELANETRCFKYWSEKQPSPKEVILEEYVDCLHFILSIGLEKEFSDVNFELKEMDNSLTEQFLNLYIDLNDFVICQTSEQYITLFEDFLSLGISMGFSDKDIEGAYLAKNTINHQRQNSGY
ncbi:MAG: dUTP diphosphatase [Bacillota bacterium]|nr:dUTP diphosphatase [Bacillota bacterium]